MDNCAWNIEGGGMAPIIIKPSIERAAGHVSILQHGIHGEDDLVLVHEHQLPGLISALQECKTILSAGHAAQGEPASAEDEAAHETPGRRRFFIHCAKGHVTVRNTRPDGAREWRFSSPKLVHYAGLWVYVTLDVRHPERGAMVNPAGTDRVFFCSLVETAVAS